jgi:hypothetical protein
MKAVVESNAYVFAGVFLRESDLRHFGDADCGWLLDENVFASVESGARNPG